MSKKFSLDTGDNLGIFAGRLSVRQKKTINFEKEDPFDKETVPIFSRRRAAKLKKGDGEEQYDNEKQTSEDDDEDGLMFMSQQLEEDFNIMMSPKRQEL